MTEAQGQLDIEVPARLFRATPSLLGTWLDCPRRYKFGYVDRPMPPKGPPWAHQTVGAAVHAALRAWWLLPEPARTPDAAAGLVRTSWQPAGFHDEAQADDWRERAAAMVARYAATLDPADDPVGVERTVALRTDRLALSGRIDRLDRRGAELVVVDYKTGRHLLSTDDARGSMALAIYALAAASTMRRACSTVELHHLPTGEVIRWVHTEASLARHLDRVHDVASEIVTAEAAAATGDPDEVFPPRPGPLCGWCDFRAHCPEGQAASPSATVSWAGLPDDATSAADDVLD
jgi:RecB family exonuclease